MDISRKTDYAFRILAMLVGSKGSLLSVRTAAEEMDVPYSFARSIQHELTKVGFIESLRGVRGGMRLKIDPASITVNDIIEAMQGPLVVNKCLKDGKPCPRRESCCYHPIWIGAKALLRDYLSSVTLEEAVNCKRNPCVNSKFTKRSEFPNYVSRENEYITGK
ncbi:transcriptional regulator, BadM/Rrf2 family [Coriobacterium glomerans PW2]|uniref:Transcriptional regulator, BadM/Rrf2 family n=1 Tax=Coriobacterium glomerans (strain ATCC 49209 / DSM 20642 / JCM 10262 / PW2) TaxID=700015 RepID=F2N945_CORGP|nr:Rrf2 family transcriptional regulator [Coriobacterium glomerans]AEB07721.1 transcriptional regulator, BadM/Rrf2 family [Coriobacterium glomerans PW2]